MRPLPPISIKHGDFAYTLSSLNPHICVCFCCCFLGVGEEEATCLFPSLFSHIYREREREKIFNISGENKMP